MKYAGSITIIDDQGEVAYERDLTQDELIDELLTSRTPAATITVTDKPIVPAAQVAAIPSPRTDGFRKCSVCGGFDHTSRKCPRNTPEAFGITTREKSGDQGTEPKQGRPCCGSLGVRHKNDCPTKQTPAGGSEEGDNDLPPISSTGDQEVLNLTPLSESEFELLKERQEADVSAEDIADEFDHDVDDVRVAMQSSSRIAYLFERKKMIAKRLQKRS